VVDVHEGWELTGAATLCAAAGNDDEDEEVEKVALALAPETTSCQIKKTDAQNNKFYLNNFQHKKQTQITNKL
jgi:hypothetical protein